MASFEERVGEAIGAARKRKGLTQQKLADQAGMNLRSLTRIEKGETLPALDSFAKLAAVLELDPAAVLNIQPPQRKVSRARLDRESDAQELIEGLTEARLEDLIKIAQTFKGS